MDKLEVIETNKEKTAQATDIWRIDKNPISLMELQDFGQYLIITPEHERGEFTSLQMELSEALKVIFFGDGPDDDSEFEIKHNRPANTFEVTCLKGDKNKMTPLLSRYGFSIESEKD